jgi:HD-like signal output (HDOD) protein
MSTTAKELAEKVKTLQSLPATFHKLQEVVDDPDSTTCDISDVILADPSLSGRTLKLANSSFYGFPSTIESVSHAVTMIGAEQIVALVHGTSVISLFSKIPSHLLNMEQFWRHSIACGVAARMIAARRRDSNTERFFLLGLLHDIGRLIIFTHLPNESATAMERAAAEKKPLVQCEFEACGFDHTAVGHELLLSWKLPARLWEPIRMHHTYSTSSIYPVETAILHTADVLVNAMSFGSSGERMVPPLHPPHWSATDMDVGMIAPMQVEIGRQIGDLVKIMMP